MITYDFHIFHNISLWCAVIGWTLAQSLKMVIAFFRHRAIDFSVLVSLGGLPSAHSAMSSALATSIGLQQGFSSPLFALSFVFAGVVMFDAQSVRRAAGQQAKLLNQIIQELYRERHFPDKKLAELLGHTPLEVLLGMGLGIATALLVHAYAPFPS